MRHLNHATEQDESLDVPSFRNLLRSEWGFMKLSFRRSPEAFIAAILCPVILLLAVISNCLS